jgi:hypothetical protein
MGWAETVARVARTEQPVVFGGPEARYRISRRDPTASSISARPRHAVGWPTPGENGGTAMSLAVPKILLSNRFYVSEWLGSPCPIPQPV